MSILYDVILAAIFILNIRRGWRLGVLSALLGLVGWGAAAFIVQSSSDKLDIMIYVAAIAVLILFRFLAQWSARRCRGRGVLGRTNQILGGVLGLGEAVVVGYVYALLLYLLASVLTVSWISPAILSGTRLVRLYLS